MVLFMNTAIINEHIGSVFLHHVYLVSLKVYESNKSIGGKVLAITVKHESVIESESCLETIEVPINGLYNNESIITTFTTAVNKVSSKSNDVINVDDILGDMLAK